MMRRLFVHWLAFSCLFVCPVALTVAAEEPSIRVARDYEKYGMPKDDAIWSEMDHFTALQVLEKLAKANPTFLPSSSDDESFDYFRRLTNPRKLSNSGPTGEKYFAALEKLYLDYGKANRERFDFDFPKIQHARLTYVYNQLGARNPDRNAIADEVFSALMAWSRQRFDLKGEYSENFDRNMRESENSFVYILKRMSPEFQEKVLLKLDAVAVAYPDAAKAQKIAPDFIEKLLKEVSVRPQGMKFEMKRADVSDVNNTWNLKELYVAVKFLKRQSEIDKTKLPREDSAILQKMLSPSTIQSVFRAEEDATQLATAPNARAQYLQAYHVYFGAGVKEYADETAALLKAYSQLLWADLERFHKSLATRAALAKSFDNNARGFCTLTLGHTFVAREHFPADDFAYFQAFAVHYYPRAFRMQSEESRVIAATEFFEFKESTEGQLKFAKGDLRQRWIAQKRVMDQIEAAIRVDIPKNIPKK